MNFLKSLFTFQSSVVPDDGGGGAGGGGAGGGDDGVNVNPSDPSVHMSDVQQDLDGGDASHQAFYTPGLESLGRNIYHEFTPSPNTNRQVSGCARGPLDGKYSGVDSTVDDGSSYINLPKINYKKLVNLSLTNFTRWSESIERLGYSRNWNPMFYQPETEFLNAYVFDKTDR